MQITLTRADAECVGPFCLKKTFLERSEDLLSPKVLIYPKKCLLLLQKKDCSTYPLMTCTGGPPIPDRIPRNGVRAKRLPPVNSHFFIHPPAVPGPHRPGTRCIYYCSDAPRNIRKNSCLQPSRLTDAAGMRPDASALSPFP